MTTVNRALLIHHSNGESLLKAIDEAARKLGCALLPVPIESFLGDPNSYLLQAAHVVALLEGTELALVMREVQRHGFTLGLLPLHPRSLVCRVFEIPTPIEAALALALEKERAITLDLLLCNEEVVLWMVMAGEVPFLNLRRRAYVSNSLLDRFGLFFKSLKKLFRLKPFSLTLTTGKEQQIKTAVTGIVVVEHDMGALAANLVNESISAQDGKLSSLLIAPSSILDYLLFLIVSICYRTRPARRLPAAVSYLRTRRLKLESTVPIEYFIDGRRREAAVLELVNLPKAVTVNVGDAYKETYQVADEVKDTMKLHHLPQHELRLQRLSQRLPFFSTALEEDFKELFVMLRENAKLSTSFVLLMMLSSMLATFGMFLSSSPVVIGAMVLAPLMGPIVSLSMGLLRNDRVLLQNSLRTLGVGVFIGLSVATLLALLIPYKTLTAEISARLHPTLLDLGVAVVSGVAGAYAHANESVQKSLPGVAIAVALVPPLCVVGIGIGWMNWAVISGAALLFLTNFVGIALAGALTFWVLGYARVLRVGRGLRLSLVLLVSITLPLYLSFKNIIVYNQIEKVIRSHTYEVDGREFQLANIAVLSVDKEVHIVAELRSRRAVQEADIAAIKEQISHLLKQPVVLEVTVRLVR
jgi:uncharacterized hydrophobic protein (TIGR00271 family)